MNRAIVLYVQVRLSKQCKRMNNESNDTFKWKNLQTINGNFNTLMFREMQMLNKESKEGMGKYIKNPLKGMKKNGWAKGRMSFTLRAL